MRASIKLSGKLYEDITADLDRPHPFASERVGFALGRITQTSGESAVVLLSGYHVIPDEQYVDDPKVGARISRDAIVWATQAAYYGRSKYEGVFHVHRHDMYGETGMSIVDRHEIPALVKGFQVVSRNAAHGIIVLSYNHGSAWVLAPNGVELAPVSTISVIGSPLRVFATRRKW